MSLASSVLELETSSYQSKEIHSLSLSPLSLSFSKHNNSTLILTLNYRLHLHRPTSIHPKDVPLSGAFEEYCALAEYVAEDSSQVSFTAGDKVVVMSKDESGISV